MTRARTGALVFGLLAVSLDARASGDPARGEYLVHAGGCISCHRGETEEPTDLSGGRALESPFGTFYAPNITPDRESGIGGWSLADFERAMHEGRSPSDEAYFPAFPYVAYTGVTDDDLADLKSYLDGLAPVSKTNRAHDLTWYVNRWTMKVWQWLFFEPQPESGAAFADSAIARGAYLVRHLGHCGECHTPRNWLGVLDSDADFAGNPDGPEGEKVPNITPDKKTGIGDWSERDISSFLGDGMLPDGDFAGHSMSDVIDDNTSHLTEDDRRAIAAYLKRGVQARATPRD